ncbi:MAG: DUF6531 domain-containing protein [Kiloniellales bacterium]|nr:DUF6531 domain-containing protein [Kiloniellales bacterium]
MPSVSLLVGFLSLSLGLVLAQGSASAQALDPDLNDDGIVNILDVSMVGSCMGQDPNAVQQCTIADTDGDGDVDMDDINFVVAAFGQTFPPPDTIPPIVEISDPEDGAEFSSSPIMVSGTVDDETATVEVNGIPATMTNGTFKVTGVPLTEGPNFITATARDPAGNVGEDEVFVTLEVSPQDIEPPTLVIVSPADASDVLENRPLIELTYSDDDSGVDTSTLAFFMNDEVIAPDCDLRPGGATCRPVNPLPEGDVRLEVLLEDLAGNLASAEVDFFVNSLPQVSITAPPNFSLFNASPIEVSGTVDDTNATVMVNGIAAIMTGQAWTAMIPIEEGENTITAVAIDDLDRVGTASIQATLDTQAPIATVDSPRDDFVSHQPTIAVAGMINDIVAGTVNSNDVEVLVNGIPAQVANRSYYAKAVPLVQGSNEIEVTATDRAGNTSSTMVEGRFEPLVDRPMIELVSGQDQTGPIGGVLPEPLVVQLLSGQGIPVANRDVVFRVILGDGAVRNGVGSEARALVVPTNADGFARVEYRLGARAGIGNHQVRASAVGFKGEALFFAVADSIPGDKINVVAGNNQRGAVNQALPQPLVVAVTDAGSNLIAGAEVEFAVVTQGGSFSNGDRVLQTTTDSDGRARAQFILGQDPGLDLYRVAVTLAGTSAFAGFTASGFVPGDPAQTRISGIVLDNQDNPIPGVTLRIEDSDDEAVADEEGQFQLAGVPVGPLHLIADGSTATVPGVWPTLSFSLVTVPGVDNPLPAPIYLVALDMENARMVGAEDVDYALPEIPGFKLTVKAGSATFPDGSNVGELSVTVVNANKVPMPPPNGMQPQFIITIQPANVVFDPPAPLTLPNVDGHPPGAQVEMYSFDHDLEEFVTIGLGTVSADGAVIESDPGVGVVKSGWHCGSQPEGTGCLHNCPKCLDCQAPDCDCNIVTNNQCNVPCGDGFCPFCEVCDPATKQCVPSATPTNSDPNRPRIEPCVPPEGPGDGTCDPACGTCLVCEDSECIPDPACEGDGTCDQPCPECTICRNGDCVPDLRCSENGGPIDPEFPDETDESDRRDGGPDEPEQTPLPTTPPIHVSGEPTTSDLPHERNKHSTKTTTDQGLDPILMFSGELLIETTDLRIPGRGFDFEFKRTYRSRFENNGVLGHNWEHNHSEKLIFPGNNSKIVIRSNGFSRIDIYESLGGGRFRSPEGFFDELWRNPDGSYTIRNFDGFKTHFSRGGITRPARLVAREDRHGNRMRYIYQEDTPLGLRRPLDRVIDTLGRVIRFGYNDRGRLTTVTDFAGRRVRFTYDQHGNLVKARTPLVVRTSTGNDFTSGKTTRYEYFHDPFAIFNPKLERLNHNLTAIIDPKGQRYLEMTYETSTSSYAFDRVINQRQGTAGQVSQLTYTELNENAPRQPYDPTLPRNQTVVVDRKGNRTVLIHNGRGNLLEERRETNRNVNPADPAVFVTTHTYDEDGHRLSTTLPEGNRVEYVYDTSNPDRLQQRNLRSETRRPGSRGGDQTRIRTTYTYEPIYNQVRSVVEARGNDPSYVPQNGGATSANRYRTRNIFDYQEGGNTAALAAAMNRPVAEVAAALAAAGVSMALGDLNADGTTSQRNGNVVRRVAPTVNLLSGSQQAGIEGDLTQEVITEFIYNRFGQLTAEIDPEGNVDETFYYPERDPDGDGNRTPTPFLATDTGGYRSEVVRDSRTHQRRRGTAALTQISNRWRYDQVGNVIETTDGRGNATRYVVNSLNQVERKISEAPFNFEHTFIYDANDNVVREEIQNVDTNGPGLDASVTYTYEYDILDNRITKTEEIAAGEIITTRYSYDRNENPGRTTLPEGNVIEQVYDERDLLFRRTRGAGSADASTQTFTYDGNGNLERTVDAEDNNGDGLRESTVVTYDGFDRKRRSVDAVGNLMTYRYDPASNVIREQSFGLDGGPSPPGNSGAGNVLLSESEHRYDELSRKFETSRLLFANTRTVGPEGPLTPNDGRVTTRSEFDRSSRLTRVLDDNVHQRRTTYDGADRPIVEIDHLDNEIRKTYDGNDNVIEITELERSPEGLVPDETFVANFEYDSLDRRTVTIDNLGNRTDFRYDSRDNLIETTDPLGNTTTHTYDGINRKLSDVVDLRFGGTGAGSIDSGNDANPDGRISREYDWDRNSRLVAETDDNGNVTQYGYDALDRRVRETFEDGTTKEYTFDRDDNLIRYVDQNGTICVNSYDGINRLVRKDVNRAAGVEGTTEQRFEYDGLSRRTRATDDNDPSTTTDDSDVQLHYDSLSRPIAEVQNGVEVGSRFDGVGNRLGLSYPNGRQLEMTYDELDRLSTLHNAGSPLDIAAYSYIGPSRVLERSYANGTRLLFHDEFGTDAGYDGIKRVVEMRHVDAEDTLLAGYAYAYDKMGNRRYELDQFLASADVYEYDSAYRLTRTQAEVSPDDIAGIVNNDNTNADVETLTGVSASAYTLDGVGNRDTLASDQQTITYQPNVMNEYEILDGVAQIHDDNGNLLDDGHRRLSYDVHNRLVRVADSAGNLIALHVYDALNRRIRKELDSGETRYIYSDAQVIEERDHADVITKQFVYGGGIDEVLELVTGGESYFYHENSIGSVSALSDDAGTAIERYGYGAYGETSVLAANGTTEVSSSTLDNPYRFTGRRHDPESDVYYYRARFYDPARGRFLQRDPKGYIDGMGLYEYVKSNPINFDDPMGTEKRNGSAGSEDNEKLSLAGRRHLLAGDLWKEWLAEIQSNQRLLKGATEGLLQRLVEQHQKFSKAEFESFARTFRKIGGKEIPAGIVKQGTKGFVTLKEWSRALGLQERAKSLMAASKFLARLSRVDTIKDLGLSTFKTVVATLEFSEKFDVGFGDIPGILGTMVETRRRNIELKQIEQRRAETLRTQAAPLVTQDAGGACNPNIRRCLVP